MKITNVVLALALTTDLVVGVRAAEIAGVSSSAPPAPSSIDRLAALHDGATPTRSSNRSVPRCTWWPQKGSPQWVEYRFKSPTTVSSSEIFWFDDSKHGGGCALPSSCELLALAKDGSWKSIPTSSATPPTVDAFTRLTVPSPVATSALRLRVQLKEDLSAGILEWQINGERNHPTPLRPYIIPSTSTPAAGAVLEADAFAGHIARFNKHDEELYQNTIPNQDAWAFLRHNIPLFECPDPMVEEIYYFRWWTYRKHLKNTPYGWVVTEFLPPVSWASAENTINCPAGHQIYEGRWMRDPRFVRDYIHFYFTAPGARPRHYSFWAADATHALHQVHPDRDWLAAQLPHLVRNHEGWQREKRLPSGLYHQIDSHDGMEVSSSGQVMAGRIISALDAIRPTINSYMYGDAKALGKMATLLGDTELASRFEAEATALRQLVQQHLWSENLEHFISRPIDLARDPAEVREQVGFVPWYFHLPEKDKGFETAWRQLIDPKGFAAPFGPTTVEQRHATYQIRYEGHDCQWNGPSWPFATTQTLRALANAIRDYPGTPLTKADYHQLLQTYTKSHRLQREDGTVVPWIDENLHPHTGDWIARTRHVRSNYSPRERGKDYNHSGYADLIITGLCGIIPGDGKTLIIDPLAPDSWDHFALDRVRYHGHELTLLWDRSGKKYGRGIGMTLIIDGKVAANLPQLTRLELELPSGR